MSAFRILVVALLSAPVAAGQEPRVVTVSAATRLDWAFVAGEFGRDAARLPNDYDSTAQRYQLFVPGQYDAAKAWPLVVFISPGDGPGGWANFRAMCNEAGILFCSPYKAGNAVPAGPRVRIILDMLDDVRRQYKVDPERTYVAGFSGGGRMACSIAYGLPEYFGGVLPICGTNPPPRLTYLRHRLADRLSVAFLTGEKDFNRKENEEYMQPFLAEAGVRTRLWVAAKTGHAIPGGDVVAEAVRWLEDDLPGRRVDAGAWPTLAVKPADAPSADEAAANLLRSATAALGKEEHVWRGVALLQGIAARWPKTAAAKEAGQVLRKVAGDPAALKVIETQGAEDEVRFLSAQAKAFERFGMTAKAVEAWELLAQNYDGTAVGRGAAANAARLKKR